jgi:hypothetical protein
MSYFRTCTFLLLLSIYLLDSRSAFAQEEDEEETDSLQLVTPPKATASNKPELFSSGFIDVFNSGQVNASARFIRLYIGEPGRFTLPLSLYSGVSSNNFQRSVGENQSNSVLLANIINPLSGLANVSIEGVVFFKRNEKVTKAGILYHIGERMLTGIRTGKEDDPGVGEPYNFLNSFGSIGLYFQTGAWERGNSKNVGVAWLALRYMGCYTNPAQLKKFLPEISTNGFYHGYSIAWGVEINSVLNIKMIYYRYIKKPEIDHTQPIYQFSFNYSMKK